MLLLNLYGPCVSESDFLLPPLPALCPRRHNASSMLQHEFVACQPGHFTKVQPFLVLKNLVMNGY